MTLCIGLSSGAEVLNTADQSLSWKGGMNIVASRDPRIQKVRVTKDQIVVDLVDGRVISVPLAWSWRLSEATPAQRANFRLIGSGQGIHWPEIDEDLSVEGLLHGTPAPRPRPIAETSKARGGFQPAGRTTPTRHAPARG